MQFSLCFLIVFGLTTKTHSEWHLRFSCANANLLEMQRMWAALRRQFIKRRAATEIHCSTISVIVGGQDANQMK